MLDAVTALVRTPAPVPASRSGGDWASHVRSLWRTSVLRSDQVPTTPLSASGPRIVSRSLAEEFSG